MSIAKKPYLLVAVVILLMIVAAVGLYGRSALNATDMHSAWFDSASEISFIARDHARALRNVILANTPGRLSEAG